MFLCNSVSLCGLLCLIMQGLLFILSPNMCYICYYVYVLDCHAIQLDPSSPLNTHKPHLSLFFPTVTVKKTKQLSADHITRAHSIQLMLRPHLSTPLRSTFKHELPIRRVQRRLAGSLNRQSCSFSHTVG